MTNRKCSCRKKSKLWKSISYEILCCEKVFLLRKYPLWVSSFPERVDARTIAFLKKNPDVSKSSTSEKVAVLKTCLFWGSNVVGKVVVLKNLMICKSLLRRRSSSIDIYILNNFVFLKSSCFEKIAALNNYLFTRSSWSVKVSLWISSYDYWEKVSVLKKYLLQGSCPEEVAAWRK